MHWPLPPLVWRMESPSPLPTGTWIVVPGTSASRIGHIPDDIVLLLGMHAEELDRRAAQRVGEHLAALGRTRCEGILIENAALESVKAGGPFHRLLQLRDRGLVQMFLIEAPDASLGEWMIDSTPVDAVAMPFGLLDQGAAYRALAAAEDAGIALLAAPVRSATWTPPEPVSPELDLAFLAGEPRIASILHPMPTTAQAQTALLSAAQHPMDASQRQSWWERYQQAAKPPAKIGRHPPPEEL